MEKISIFLAGLLLGGCALSQLQTNELQEGELWQWQAATADSDSFTLQLQDNRWLGRAGCNRFFSVNSQWDESQLVLGRIASTRMMCQGDLAQQEQLFLQKLGQVHRYQRRGEQLILQDKAKQELLRFNLKK